MEEKIDICRTLELSVFVYTLSRRCHRQLIVCMKLHQLPVLDVFFCLLRLSERAHKGHTTFISSSSSFSFLMLDFLVDSYIVVWISVRLLLSEPRDRGGWKPQVDSHGLCCGWRGLYLGLFLVWMVDGCVVFSPLGCEGLLFWGTRISFLVLFCFLF